MVIDDKYISTAFGVVCIFPSLLSSFRLVQTFIFIVIVSIKYRIVGVILFARVLKSLPAQENFFYIDFFKRWVDQLTSNPSYELLFYTGISVLGGFVAIAWYIIDVKQGRRYATLYMLFTFC